eukprot:m.166982 g.166982  ORF g.166982 m.166982 type:complete len:111 (-) comp14718_c0_seq3:420-752(-)
MNTAHGRRHTFTYSTVIEATCWSCSEELHGGPTPHLTARKSSRFCDELSSPSLISNSFLHIPEKSEPTPRGTPPLRQVCGLGTRSGRIERLLSTVPLNSMYLVHGAKGTD